MSNRGKPGQKPNKVSYEDLLSDLQFGTWTITTLELVYRESVRRRTDIPEGARNLLTGTGDADNGILHFAKEVRSKIGVAELAYYRGRQEGKDVPEKDWDGGFKNKAVEKT